MEYGILGVIIATVVFIVLCIAVPLWIHNIHKDTQQTSQDIQQIKEILQAFARHYADKEESATRR